MARMRWWAGWLMMCLLLAAGAGCNAVGAISYAAMGPPTQPARYVPQQKPMVVFVENYQAPSAVAVDADRLAALVSRELAENNVAPIVDVSKVLALRERKGPAFSEMRISEIGREVGAEQVLYIELLVSQTEQPTSELMRAKLAARVRVVDVETGRSLWPEELGAGYPLLYETPLRQQADQMTPTALRDEMLRTMARRTARLFHAWKPRDGAEAAAG